MHALHLSFADPSPWRQRVVGLFSLAAVAATLALAALSWQDYQTLQALRLERARQQAREQDLRVRQQQALEAARAPKPYQKEAEQLWRTAAFPWQGVLHALESSLRPGVRLTRLDVAAQEGKVTIELEFTSQDELLKYIEALNAGDARRPWELLQLRSVAGAPGQASAQSTWPVTLTP